MVIRGILPPVTRPWFLLRYENVRETIKKLCAPEIGEKIKPIWGFNGEYELNSVWRDCGVDKMWISFGMVESPHYPHHPLNFDFLGRENRERELLEVLFNLRGAANQSDEGGDFQRRKIFAMICKGVNMAFWNTIHT